MSDRPSESADPPTRLRIEVPLDPRDLPGDFPHRFAVTIRFGDTDAMGHTNNSRFLTFCESARIDYWEAATGEAFALVTHGAEESLILAEIRVTYRSPSFCQARLVATAEDVLVLYDYTTERPRVIPDELIARLEAYEGRPLRDGAWSAAWRGNR